MILLKIANFYCRIAIFLEKWQKVMFYIIGVLIFRILAQAIIDLKKQKRSLSPDRSWLPSSADSGL